MNSILGLGSARKVIYSQFSRRDEWHLKNELTKDNLLIWDNPLSVIREQSTHID